MPRLPFCFLAFLVGGVAALSLAGCAEATVAQDQQQLPCSKPVWPAEALKARYTGTTTLSYLLGTDGSVRDTKVIKSSGHPILDDAAQEGFRRCRFKPVVKNGQPVEAWYRMQYVWSLP
jgi:TonB family protein